MDQNQTPLLDAIENFREQKPAFFRIPAHNFHRGADRRALEVLGERAYLSDLTEAEGMDDLHHPEGTIAEAQELAAELFGSKYCWFMVNGTTGGNEAMILSAVKPGEKILVPRNAHKSVLMGLILSGAVPVWVMPESDNDWNISGAVSPETIRRSLVINPEIKAVFLVSPSYYGICSDLRKIAQICHAHHIPLLVDEAHGSHMHFNRKLPEDAVSSGADLVAQSTHKTCGSMTQSSMLHWNSELIPRERVDESLKLVMSTSPNYLLMGSLDGARHMLAQHGREMTDRAIAMADIAREEISEISGFRTMNRTNTDACRLVFSARDLGISGYRLQELLYETDHVSCELSDAENVVAIISWGSSGDDIRRLVNACQSISEQYSGRAASAGQLRFTGQNAETAAEKSDTCIPPMRLTPREAFYAEEEGIPFADAAGRIAAESIIPYPPGIPLIYPGEVITEEILEAAMQYFRDGRVLHGIKDQTLTTFSVIK